MNTKTHFRYIALLILLTGGTALAYYANAHILVGQLFSSSISGTIIKNSARYGKCAGPNYHSMQIKTPQYGIIRATFSNEELNIPVSEVSSLEGKNIKITLGKTVFNSLQISPLSEYWHLGRTILRSNTYIKLEISGKQIAGIPQHLRVKKC